ncbi:hypothetical protein AAFF_G00354990 [Aldrovandia affinis]|uniref:Uncharacterized protein n=1 Tax=Aldrovandia affinis TaxID=143900 RepID=A0AAD7SJK0_9TELE|nr:hypothetical protein AAFF_G00354990 [Aldrovandia affinis]
MKSNLCPRCCWPQHHLSCWVYKSSLNCCLQYPRPGNHSSPPACCQRWWGKSQKRAGGRSPVPVTTPADEEPEGQMV